MRVFGFPLPARIARFVRFRISELSEWPRQSFLFIGGRLYVRSWRFERESELMGILGGSELELNNFSGLRVWKPASMPFLANQERVTAILSSAPYGRFGNRVVQAAAGLAAAEIASSSIFLLRSQDFSSTKKNVLVGDPPIRILVSGSEGFFFRPGLGACIPAGLVIEANWLRSQSIFPSRTAIVRGYESLRGASIIAPPSDVESPPVEFVLHFRGTDQIGHIWRPPPLAYYEKAVRHSGASRVRVVTDDPSSSLVHELKTRLERCDTETIVQSTEIQKDIATILLAPTFILGIGSFSSSLAGLSRTLKTAYSWSQPDWDGWTKFYGTFDLRPDIRNFFVVDPSGAYVRFFTENKVLSARQIVRHMIDFPIEDLEVSASTISYSG